MSFLDELRASRGSSGAAYLEFIENHSKTQRDIHIFLEGRDDPSFYLTFLQKIVPNIQKIRVYRCSNKEGVLYAHQKVARYIKYGSRVLFFVDKDHSDFVSEKKPNAPNIYVTDFYSIENYIVTEDMLRRIWYDFFDITTRDADIESIIGKFKCEQERFYYSMLPLSAWIILNRRRGLKPNLNNVKLSELYVFDTDLILQTKCEFSESLTYIERVCDVDHIHDLQESLPEVIDELKPIEPKKYVRGKYDLWFLCTFIEKLKVTLNDVSKSTGQSFKVRTQIGVENAVEVLGPRVQIPQSLQDFFSNNGLIHVTQ